MIYGVSFSDDLAVSLAKDLIEQYHDNPLELAKVHVILPTKRACLTIKNAFAEEMGEKSCLLPKLTALYNLD
ncbi:MAG: hypothetical protein II942_00305, partial [Alphaproteobacteria bacterium]|nr:hypothetical protein [Alphaproteobacteria bacterium]